MEFSDSVKYNTVCNSLWKIFFENCILQINSSVLLSITIQLVADQTGEKVILQNSITVVEQPNYCAPQFVSTFVNKLIQIPIFHTKMSILKSMLLIYQP